MKVSASCFFCLYLITSILHRRAANDCSPSKRAPWLCREKFRATKKHQASLPGGEDFKMRTTWSHLQSLLEAYSLSSNISYNYRDCIFFRPFVVALSNDGFNCSTAFSGKKQSQQGRSRFWHTQYIYFCEHHFLPSVVGGKDLPIWG